MRKVFAIAVCFLAFASFAIAQTQFETKWHCGKPAAEQKFDVGDVTGHAYAITQGTCDVTATNTGEKAGAYTEFQELWKTSFSTRGRFITTMDTGDKMYYSYQSTGAPAKKTISEKWTITGGTGKHKTDKGTGTCTGTLNDDGTSDWVCSGTLSTAK